jgi:transposase
VTDKSFPLPTDLTEAHALILTLRQTAAEAEARARAAESEAKYRALLIEKLKYTIAKLRHGRFGQSSERSAVLEQLELQLSELQEDTSEAEAAEVVAEPVKVEVRPFARRKPARRPLPEHLPREKVIYPVPQACPCCGGTLHKLGEDVTETLELIPRHWKVIQHVREKYSCRSCEAITQPPAPSHPIARGRAGSGLLAHVLFSKYGLHLPLTRQSATYAREGIDLDVSTLAALRQAQEGRRHGGDAGAADRDGTPARVRRRAHPCRRHHGAGAGPGQDAHRPAVGLCARRPAVRRQRPAGGGVLLLARPHRRASRAAPGGLGRPDAGRRLRRLQPAV